MKYILIDELKYETSGAIIHRAVAAVLDYGIFSVIVFLFVLTFGERVDGGTYQLTGNLTSLLLLIWFIYFVMLEAIFKGSFGKRIMGLKVLSVNGDPVKFNHVLRRRLCDIVDIWFCYGFLGFILIKNTAYNQRLGDIWAKTIVIKETR